MSLAERMETRIHKIDDKPGYVKMLVYGPVGVGKTRFSATAPNLIFGNSESGTLSISGIDVDCYPIQKFTDMNDLGEFLFDHCALRDKLRRAVKQKAKPAEIAAIKEDLWSLAHTGERGDKEPALYDSVVLDSLSDIQKKSLDEILGDTKRLEKHDIDKANLEDYGKNTQQSRKMCRFFRDLPMHVIFVCLPVDDKEDSGEPIVRPMLTPKLAEEVMGFVDVVGYMFNKRSKKLGEDGKPVILRKMLLQPMDKFRAKFRTPPGVVPPQTITDPTFRKIFDISRGKYQENEGGEQQ